MLGFWEFLVHLIAYGYTHFHAWKLNFQLALGRDYFGNILSDAQDGGLHYLNNMFNLKSAF